MYLKCNPELVLELKETGFFNGNTLRLEKSSDWDFTRVLIDIDKNGLRARSTLVGHLFYPY